MKSVPYVDSDFQMLVIFASIRQRQLKALFRATSVPIDLRVSTVLRPIGVRATRKRLHFKNQQLCWKLRSVLFAKKYLRVREYLKGTSFIQKTMALFHVNFVLIG